MGLASVRHFLAEGANVVSLDINGGAAERSIEGPATGRSRSEPT